MSQEEVKWTADNLWVVVENQLGGYEACDTHNGHLYTYATREEAEVIALQIIDGLNDIGSGAEGYGPNSWTAVLLRDAEIGDNQEKIVMPDEECSDDCSCTTTDMSGNCLHCCRTEEEIFKLHTEGCDCMTIEEWGRK